MSIGIVGMSEITCEPEFALQRLLNAADQALYQSKGNGRNQVNVYSNDLQAIAQN